MFFTAWSWWGSQSRGLEWGNEGSHACGALFVGEIEFARAAGGEVV